MAKQRSLWARLNEALASSNLLIGMGGLLFPAGLVLALAGLVRNVLVVRIAVSTHRLKWAGCAIGAGPAGTFLCQKVANRYILARFQRQKIVRENHNFRIQKELRIVRCGPNARRFITILFGKVSDDHRHRLRTDLEDFLAANRHFGLRPFKSKMRVDESTICDKASTLGDSGIIPF